MLELEIGDPEAMRRKARQLRRAAMMIAEVAVALDRRVQVAPYAGARGDAFRSAMTLRRREALRIAEDIQHTAWLLGQAGDRVEAQAYASGAAVEAMA